MNEMIKPVPGLHYISNYLNQTEQEQLISLIDQQPWITDLKRRVQHYGYRYDYSRKRIDSSLYLGALPNWIQPLATQLHDEKWFSSPPNQLIINEYQPGQGISKHIDCVPCFGETIASISLGSPCIMVFTHPSSNEQIPWLLEPCSLLIMKAEARYEWQHSIPARKSDVYQEQKIKRTRRMSLTFRTVIHNQELT